ncbi:hypothetical protein GCM10028778_15580 [Barrientosiimonas marina]|uniref:NERD domain-containing protein n=1 Tax=Lentibacillus kimchii TaxID=1542911 RepID=A0ABW2UTN6_9BACI
MILKRRSKPLPLRKLDALLPRLSPNFPELIKIQEDAKRQQRGYSGELRVDYFLDYLAPKFTILHDVYLRTNGKNFQIDSLIIADHTIFIVDSKHYQGLITFNTILRQLTRSDNQIESGFEYPITQVKNQIRNLEHWLNQLYFSKIPIKGFVAIADPATIVKVEGSQEEVSSYVAHAAEIHERIVSYDRQMSDEGAKKLSGPQIGKAILSQCGTFDINLFKQHNLQQKDIRSGVRCPDCGQCGMKRVHSGWLCEKCNCYSKHEHITALNDYLLLIKETITNQECMNFLGLNSRHVASRILKNSGLDYYPQTRKWHNVSNRK